MILELRSAGGVSNPIPNEKDIMNININTWHYHLYQWTYGQLDKYDTPPKHTNLCQYLRRLCIGVPWFATLNFLYSSIMFAMALIGSIASFLLLPFFVRPIFFYTLKYDTQYNSGPIKEIEPFHLPLKDGYSLPIYPFYICLPALIILGEYEWHHHASNLLLFNIVNGIFWSGLLLLAIIIFGFDWFQKNETVQLIKAGIEAKTKGICPLVWFQRPHQELVDAVESFSKIWLEYNNSVLIEEHIDEDGRQYISVLVNGDVKEASKSFPWEYQGFPVVIKSSGEIVAKSEE
jgi:hypothetical protein